MGAVLGHRDGEGRACILARLRAVDSRIAERVVRKG